MTSEEQLLFTEEQKDFFYKKAENYLKRNGLTCLKVDRDKFCYSRRDGIVKVFFLSFNKKMVSKEKLAHAKTLKRIVITSDRTMPRKKGTVIPTRENGYVWFRVNKEE